MIDFLDYMTLILLRREFLYDEIDAMPNKIQRHTDSFKAERNNYNRLGSQKEK